VEATAPRSKKIIWTGGVVSAIPVLLMLFSAAMKFVKPAAVVQGMVRFGYPERQLFILGVLESLSCVVYLIPRMAVLGAILMTGYLGGATASNSGGKPPTCGAGPLRLQGKQAPLLQALSVGHGFCFCTN
jgi:hypothetical protein